VQNKSASKSLYTHPKTAKVKYASLHDLRRSFGERWALRVMPTVLMDLMRHESIQTTMKHYVGQTAQTTADIVSEAYGKAATGNTFGNTCPNSPEAGNEDFSQPFPR
jgi:integrase